MNLSEEDKGAMRIRNLKDIQETKNYTKENIESFLTFFKDYLGEFSSTLKLLGGTDQKYKELMIDTKIVELKRGELVYDSQTSIFKVFGVFSGKV